MSDIKEVDITEFRGVDVDEGTNSQLRIEEVKFGFHEHLYLGSAVKFLVLAANNLEASAL